MVIEVGNAPKAITPTPEELKASAYDTANIEAALEALHQDGFVVLKNVVDVGHVEAINAYMSKEADELVRTKAKAFNQGVNSNFLQCPPLKEPELLYNDVFFNPFVIQLMNIYLGGKPIWNFVTANNALPKTNGLRQPVHKDITFFHPQVGRIAASPPRKLTLSSQWLNRVLAWLSRPHFRPRSVHRNVTSTLANARLIEGEPETFVLPSVVEERRKIRPPIQPVCQKGDMMLRDLRTWHAGMPNESDDYRLMIALGYQAQWWPNHTLRTKLPLSRGNFFMKHGACPVEVRADLLPDDADFSTLNDDFTFRRS